jgi:hypothetical protein
VTENDERHYPSYPSNHHDDGDGDGDDDDDDAKTKTFHRFPIFLRVN